MDLRDLIEQANSPEPWEEGEKIPWHEPAFSQRMLKEHLSQKHNAASRKLKIIEQHVHWLHHTILQNKPSNILDLGCGPGLYTQRLAALGHRCLGLDFSPASIAYAKSQVTDDLALEYRLGDIRKEAFGIDFDLILLVFGEFNVFRIEDAERILCKAYDALSPNGTLVLEVQALEALRKESQLPATWRRLKQGLFSEHPHLWLEEHFWHEEHSIATTRHIIVHTDGKCQRYTTSSQAYSDEEYERFMKRIGFTKVRSYASLTGQTHNSSDFPVWVGQRAGTL